MKLYKSDISKLTGCAELTTRDYINQGLLVPTIKRASGPGQRNIFSRNDACRAVLFAMLVQWGLSRAEASELSLGLSGWERYTSPWWLVASREPGEGGLLSTGGGSIYEGEPTVPVLPNGGLVVVVPLQEVRARVDTYIMERVQK